MKQHEAVIKIMEQNGGFATLGYLNQEVLKVSGVEWKTKTPFASIRRIVQDDRFFFKIRPGLWALKTYKNKLPENVFTAEKIPEIKQEEFNHSYYQGLLVEVGNLRKFETFIPYQDKNKKFLEKSLKDIATIEKFYKFGYEHIINRAITIDVSWFNNRKMPNSFFEVEHSAGIENSLGKFVDLQDFKTNFFIVADKAREMEFKKKVCFNMFYSIQKRVQFMSYEDLSNLHAKSFETADIENKFKF
ncbi:winged helix-turn-helix domain-containing protein [Patescibacteria group bacterium]|nr:winged helix-turn-helix domain-containing protein [Patescibacteria group bacterium]MBU4580609.1 winged helix-turn-helix domain-containing protein [Patescibacteria group bacterium]